MIVEYNYRKGGAVFQLKLAFDKIMPACILRAGRHSGWKQKSKILNIRRAWFWSNLP